MHWSVILRPIRDILVFYRVVIFPSGKLPVQNGGGQWLGPEKIGGSKTKQGERWLFVV